jgi:hypothetical protein
MQRDDAYQNLSDLIKKGFLTLSLSINDKLLIFKTVNDKEFQNARLLAGKDVSLFNLYFLVLSTLAVDGNFVLESREKCTHELFDFYYDLPDKVCVSILKELGSLRETSFEVFKFLEGFCYTGRSRTLWRVYNNNPPNLDELTGIPGTGKMGLNVHQESWINVNRALDDEDVYNQQFNFALLIASSNNPKGARQIRGKYDSNMKIQEDRRVKLAEEGYIDVERIWRPDGWALPTDTAEELVAELERQMTGKKDKHDLFIENHLKRLRNEAARRTKEAEDRIKAFRKEGMPDFDGFQRALTPEEMKEMMTSQKNPSGIVSVLENDSSKQGDKFLSKIGSKIITGKR